MIFLALLAAVAAALVVASRFSRGRHVLVAFSPTEPISFAIGRASRQGRRTKKALGAADRFLRRARMRDRT